MLLKLRYERLGFNLVSFMTAVKCNPKVDLQMNGFQSHIMNIR